MMTRNSAQKEKILATGLSANHRQRSQKTSKREGSLNLILNNDDMYYADRLNKESIKKKV